MNKYTLNGEEITKEQAVKALESIFNEAKWIGNTLVITTEKVMECADDMTLWKEKGNEI